MVCIMGKTILEHTLLAVKQAGIDSVVIVVGERDEISEAIGDGSRLGLQITYVRHIGAKGGGAALLDAKDLLEERFFLINPYRVDFGKFAQVMQDLQTSSETVVLLTKKPTSTAFGLAEINETKVTGIVEKPERILDNQLHIIGIYLLNKSFVQTLLETPLEHYHLEKALDTYAKKGLMTFLKTTEDTVSLKYAWDLFSIKDYLLGTVQSYVAPTAEVSSHAVIQGNVYIDEKAKIMEGAVIKGPAYIGKDAIVGTDAILRNGVDLEEGVVIGARLEIKNTLVMKHTTTHSGFIGDSIVGASAKIAAYICTANARLDRLPVTTLVKGEKVSSGLKHLGAIIGNNTNIGIRVSLMPGVIIGEGSIIGPSTTVMKNVAPHVKYYTRFQEIVEDEK